MPAKPEMPLSNPHTPVPLTFYQKECFKNHRHQDIKAITKNLLDYKSTKDKGPY